MKHHQTKTEYTEQFSTKHLKHSLKRLRKSKTYIYVPCLRFRQSFQGCIKLLQGCSSVRPRRATTGVRLATVGDRYVCSTRAHITSIVPPTHYMVMSMWSWMVHWNAFGIVVYGLLDCVVFVAFFNGEIRRFSWWKFEFLRIVVDVRYCLDVVVFEF